LTSLCNSKESKLSDLNTSLKRTLDVVEDQKQYIVHLNDKAQEDTQQISSQKAKLGELKAELNSFREQQRDLEQILGDSTKSLEVSERKINELQKSLTEIRANYKRDIERYEEEMKITRSDRTQLKS